MPASTRHATLQHGVGETIELGWQTWASFRIRSNRGKRKLRHTTRAGSNFAHRMDQARANGLSEAQSRHQRPHEQHRHGARRVCLPRPNPRAAGLGFSGQMTGARTIITSFDLVRRRQLHARMHEIIFRGEQLPRHVGPVAKLQRGTRHARREKERQKSETMIRLFIRPYEVLTFACVK